MPLLGMACNPLKRLRAPSRLRVALPAPDIAGAILDGRQPKGLRLAEMLGNLPGSWEDQRRAFGFRQSA